MRLPDGSKSRAVLIGTSDYDHLEPVKATGNNLVAVRSALVRHTGLLPQHCVPVPDERDLSKIGSAVQSAADQAEDLLLVYYSGHGLVDTDGELHLAQPQSARPPLLPWSAIPFARLYETIRRARASIKVVILDCCYSGRAIGGMSDEEDILGKIQITGSFTLTSSPANSVSLAPEGARYTAFTGALLEVLENGSPGAGEFLALHDIYRELLRISRDRSLPQPQLCVTHTAEHLSLARNRHRPEQVKPTPPVTNVGRSEPEPSPWHRSKARSDWPPAEPILTPEEIHSVRFKTVRLSEGYDEGEVDAFLDRVILALMEPEAGPQRMVPEAVRNSQFATTRLREGYDMDEVDAFLDQVELELERRWALRRGAGEDDSSA
ncbi:DivIVA domain-containing protein [Glycomyces sp. NRRL B-16210]|uniref:caspase, EACC1-associated type n=1 Tax=Glycomyces sp. NRRL B-16210 TaxID=1463821 RepID=UPI0009DE127A|nr:DivIVA domain-containing protein [Glycomyces sp. NRRL B-16210]